MQEVIRLDLICQGDRYRDVNETKVQEIAKSIEQQGLLQNIGVKPCDCSIIAGPHYRLLFGAHRVAAVLRLDWDTLEARVFPLELLEENARLIELEENSVRNDLTQAQRKAYAAEVGQLLLKLAEMSDSATRTEKWFIDFLQKANIPRHTFYDWWHAFCTETARAITPSHAEDGDREAFFGWLQDQEQKAETEKQRKADEAKERRRQADCNKAIRYLCDLIEEYGFEVVQREVWEVVYLQWEAQIASKDDDDLL